MPSDVQSDVIVGTTAADDFAEAHAATRDAEAFEVLAADEGSPMPSMAAMEMLRKVAMLRWEFDTNPFSERPGPGYPTHGPRRGCFQTSDDP
jgi:hypothetical protein